MKLRVDNRDVEVAEGATVLEAATKAGIAIPTLCHLPGKPCQTSCLVCVVRIDGGKRLVPSCATKAREGMHVDSSGPQIRAARRTALELLFGYHYGDCLAPCETVCPTQFDVPELIRLAKSWQLEEAMLVMLERAALPGVLARVCPAPCERSCRRQQGDGSLAVRSVERLVADADLAAGCVLPICRKDSGKRVAIVGAGPAGLATAFHLRRFGHACALFDAAPVAGGALRNALPEEVLPAAVLDAEVSRILRLGATFHGGRRLGSDLVLSDLRRDYDAVVLALGVIDAEQAKALGLAYAKNGLAAASGSGATAQPGIFVTGSAMLPAQQAVRAIASGRGVAVAVDRFLAGAEPQAEGRGWSVRVGKIPAPDLQHMIRLASASPRHEPSPGGCLEEDAAKDEASRCLACSCSSRHDCTLRRYGDEYQAEPARFRSPLPPLQRDDSHPLVSYEPGKCIACGICVSIAADYGEQLGLGFAGRGYTIQVAVPLGGSMREALQVSAVACAAACPTGAIAVKAQACPP